MYVIFKKIEELKHLLIGKLLVEQKEIIIKFFYDNRELNKHFNRFYKSIKSIFENSSLNDYYIQEFIDKTFINPELIHYYSTLNEIHSGTKYDMIEEEFKTYTAIKMKEHVDEIIWNNEDLDDFTEKKKKRTTILLYIIGIVIFIFMSITIRLLI